MAQEPISSKENLAVPGTGMRGGLGRTLLTAFLLLSIVPLSLISYLASTQGRRNLQQEVEEKLNTIAVLTDSQIESWLSSQQLVLSLLSKDFELEDRTSKSFSSSLATQYPQYSNYTNADASNSRTFTFLPYLYERIATYRAQKSTLRAILLLDAQGRVQGAYPPISSQDAFIDLVERRQTMVETTSPLIQAFATNGDDWDAPVLAVTHAIAQKNMTLVALVDSSSLAQALHLPTYSCKNGEIYLVLPSRQTLKLSATSADNYKDSAGTIALQHRDSRAIQAALVGQSGTGNYENYEGTNVIGAYRWLPALNAALLVEQPLDVALASSDDLAVLLIGAALGVALLTALIASAVTRRITLPIVQLTATAVQIASGDLDQKVSTDRRDEIGILARAFNVMTTKLRILYQNLEQKVQERTQQLQAATAQIRYRAMQLATGAEMARVVTSILDQEALLSRVVELVRDCFQAYFVAIYFIDESGQWATIQEGSGGLGAELKSKGYAVDLSQDSVISRAVQRLKPEVSSGQDLKQSTEHDLFPHTSAQLAVPLKIGDRNLGVLDVHSVHKDAFDGDESMVLETLAGQVAVAIENARVYQLERETAEQLRQSEESRRKFLSHMSRELRLPLNNILGFSRVILKEIDGPINDLQREDLEAIHESGQHLLALINDILDIAEIEAGTIELSPRLVDLEEIVSSVIPTTNALLEDKPVNLVYEIAPDLPSIMADPLRLRQVLVKLLSNAAKFTEIGEITLRVWPNHHQVWVTISDTGVGIPDEHREKVFEMFDQGAQAESETSGTGLGLTFSKQIVEMHGGTIGLESKPGEGTTFTLALPIANGTGDKEEKD